MSRLRSIRVGVWVAGLCGLLAVGAGASEVQLTLGAQIRLPDSLEALEAGLSLTDLDRDNVTELLVVHPDHFARYDLLNQQTLDFAPRVSSPPGTRHVHGLIDGDGLLDYYEILSTTLQDTTLLQAVPHLSTEDWQAGDTVKLLEYTDPDLTALEEPPYVMSCSAVYSTSLVTAPLADGTPALWIDLYFKYYAMTVGEPWMILDPKTYAWITVHEYFRYIPGESGITEVSSMPSGAGAMHYRCGTESPVEVKQSTWEETGGGHGQGYWTRTGYNFQVYDGSALVFAHWGRPLYSCPYRDWLWGTARLDGYCIGDITAASDGDEILFRDYRATASRYNSEETGCEDASYQYTCYDFSTPHQTTKLYEIALDEPVPEIERLFFDCRYPGMFFDWDGTRVRLYDGSTCQVQVSSSPWTPPAELFACQALEPGGPTYLIFQSGETVWLYSVDVSTGVDGSPPAPVLPAAFTLEQPYPNPFNATVTVALVLAVSMEVRLDIFNLIGQRVSSTPYGPLPAGVNLLNWDATGFPSGIYLLKASGGGHSATARAVLIK